MNPDLFLTAPHLPLPHGFSTRRGGVSGGAYASLNLGLSTGDQPRHVEENRIRFLSLFGAGKAQTCGLSQVHSDRVIKAEASWFDLEADGSVTNNPELLLVISGADCFPLLFFDPVKGAVGAAHCGWRGSLAGIAANVVLAMAAHYGSSPKSIRVAIGPGIRGPCYEVSAEVAESFFQRGFPPAVAKPDGNRYRLDLVGANRDALQKVGVLEANIWDSGLCTHCDNTRFYSYRRDGSKTGRLWAAIRLPAPGG
jgi:YfiH family protein